MDEYRTLKAVKMISRRRVWKAENNGGDEPNQGTVCVYIVIAQCPKH
jgi:hypothetical protein